jgi:hypothetical protein
MPVLRGASSKLAATTRTEVPLPASVDMPVNGSPSHTQQDLLSPGTATGNRRQQWLEQNQHSFIFDEITDPLLLALFDTGAGVAASPPAATLPPLSEREHKQQFQPIANAIKKALEGILADVMRKFMTAAKRDGIPKPEFQEAHHAYSEMLQMFNRAKVAAVDGQEARMLAELRTICPAMEEFLRLRFKNVVQHFSTEKTEREAMKSGLRTLLAQCREWLHDDKEKAIRPWSPALAPSSPEARQRAVSSPAKPSEPMTQTESDRTERLSSSLSGHISPRSSQHRIGPYSPSAAATPSPTSTLLTSPLTSPVTSPVLNPKAVASPKESAKSFRICALIGSPLSPRSKDAGRKESPVKGHARQSLQNDSTSRSNSSAQHSEMPVTPEKATTE